MLRILIFLFILLSLGLLYTPLRRHILRRLDITTGILLVVLPLMAAIRLYYTARGGDRDDVAIVVLIVTLLVALLAGLWWLNNTWERRSPSKAPPSLLDPTRLVSRWMHLPYVPGAQLESAGLSLARLGGRWFGRAQRATQEPAPRSSQAQAAAGPARPATAPARPATAPPRPATAPARPAEGRRAGAQRPTAQNRTPDAVTSVARMAGHWFGRTRRSVQAPTPPRSRRRQSRR